MSYTVASLAERVAAKEVRGNRDYRVETAASVENAGPGQITFARAEQNLKKLPPGAAAAIIVPQNLADSLAGDRRVEAVIVVDDPFDAFIRVLELITPRQLRPRVGISPAAFVDPSAQIGTGAEIYPGAHVGPGVIIGDDCTILSGVAIGAGCRLGHQVLLHPNVVLYEGVIVGDRVTIHASAVIGADGFGYRQIDGRHEKIPHFGTVRLEDDVEIGACATIDRAMIGETLIGAGTKIDNLVVIAHNCQIGRHNLYASQVGFAGSVTTGDYVVCAGQVGIADHVHLGDGAVFGAKCGVHRNMPGAETYLGSPAEPKTEAIQAMMAARRLPEMRQKINELERQLRDLTRLIENKSGDEKSSPSAA